MDRRILFSLAAALGLCTAVAVIVPASRATEAEAAACSTIGAWRDLEKDKVREHADLIKDLADRDVVLLGERHAIPGIQRWQLHTAAALHAREPNMVLAFEAFPRSVQPALDRWVAGELSEKEFLRESRWNEVWGLGTRLYMPLFRFARMHRIPMVAMNVDRSLISRVGREGWDAIPADAREGLSDPAPVSDGYRRALSAVFESKAKQAKAAEEGAAAHGGDDAQSQDADTERRIQFFIEAQSTWDRAFAEAIAAARERKPRPLVVGIVGRGHVEHGYGLPRQLEDLGIDDVAIVLTHAANEPCERLAPDDGVRIADAVFGLDSEPERGHGGGGPRLGVMIESFGKGDEAAVRVSSVIDGSVAQSTGLKPGDLIVEAAGVRTTKSGELIAVVKRQAPGTWLPLRVQRGEQTIDVVARFPTAFE